MVALADAPNPRYPLALPSLATRRLPIPAIAPPSANPSCSPAGRPHALRLARRFASSGHRSWPSMVTGALQGPRPYHGGLLPVEGATSYQAKQVGGDGGRIRSWSSQASASPRKVKEEETAALEFEKCKGAFSVDAEATTESETQHDGQGLLHNFVEYIKLAVCMHKERSSCPCPCPCR